MRGRLLIATAVALIGLVFAVGCGDDEDSTASNPGTDTAAETTDGGSTTPEDGAGTEAEDGADTEAAEGPKAEFIVQANGICAKRSAEIQLKGQKVFKKVFKYPGPVAAKKLARAVLVPAFTRELRELKALPQPPGDNKDLNAFYKELEQIIDYFAGSPDPGTWPYNKAEKLAKSYGLEKCGSPG